MNLCKSVCGPGRAWMRSTFCSLIGWASLPAHTCILAMARCTMTVFDRPIQWGDGFLFPQIIARNHAFKAKVIQTCLSVFCKHTSWKGCKCTFLFLRRVHNRACLGFCFVLFFSSEQRRRRNSNPTELSATHIGQDPGEGTFYST